MAQATHMTESAREGTFWKHAVLAGLIGGVGAVIGLAIYLINFYGVASVMFEWFAMARNWVSFVTHLLFGLVTAWAYVALARRPGADRSAAAR